MTPKPKKHKQRFEHIAVGYATAAVYPVLDRFSKDGYELVAVDSENQILFFKRPV